MIRKKKVTKEPFLNSRTFWNYAKGLGVVLALFGAFYSFDDRYVKSEELKKQEQQTVKTLEQFQNKLENKFLRDRLDTVNDQKRQIKIMIKKDPSDTDLKEQYNEVDKEAASIKMKLDALDAVK
jgi:Tfp pilus assembly protein PilO